MRQNDCALACAFERFEDMQQKGIVTIFIWWRAVFKTTKFVVIDIDAVAPALDGKRWIGNRKVEAF